VFLVPTANTQSPAVATATATVGSAVANDGGFYSSAAAADTVH